MAVLPALALGNARFRNQEGRFTRSLTPFPTLEAYVEASAHPGVGLTRMSAVRTTISIRATRR